MVETIKQVLGLEVNDVFITNFHKFANAVERDGLRVHDGGQALLPQQSEPEGEQYF